MLEKDIPCKHWSKKAKLTKLLPDKGEFKAKKITRDGHYIMIKGQATKT